MEESYSVLIDKKKRVTYSWFFLYCFIQALFSLIDTGVTSLIRYLFPLCYIYESICIPVSVAMGRPYQNHLGPLTVIATGCHMIELLVQVMTMPDYNIREQMRAIFILLSCSVSFILSTEHASLEALMRRRQVPYRWWMTIKEHVLIKGAAAAA